MHSERSDFWLNRERPCPHRPFPYRTSATVVNIKRYLIEQVCSSLTLRKRTETTIIVNRISLNGSRAEGLPLRARKAPTFFRKNLRALQLSYAHGKDAPATMA